MSEWYDSQKEAKVAFLKFLQEHFDKENIRCKELTEKEKRIEINPTGYSTS
jgi:hypothetical protein